MPLGVSTADRRLSQVVFQQDCSCAFTILRPIKPSRRLPPSWAMRRWACIALKRMADLRLEIPRTSPAPAMQARPVASLALRFPVPPLAFPRTRYPQHISGASPVPRAVAALEEREASTASAPPPPNAPADFPHTTSAPPAPSPRGRARPPRPLAVRYRPQRLEQTPATPRRSFPCNGP